MEPIDIDRELQELVANEELLAFFDFVLPLDGREIEGLCKVSRPRERRSRSTYLSIFFTVDLADDAAYRAVESHLRKVDWGACSDGAAGVDCFVAIPHRGVRGGLFLKEVDVYLDGSRPPDASFVREILQPALARAVGLRAGELTLWEDTGAPTAPAAAPPAGAERASLLTRLRRFGGNG